MSQTLLPLVFVFDKQAVKCILCHRLWWTSLDSGTLFMDYLLFHIEHKYYSKKNVLFILKANDLPSRQFTLNIHNKLVEKKIRTHYNLQVAIIRYLQ